MSELLPDSLLTELAHLARAGWPREVCGYVLRSPRGWHWTLRGQNVHPTPHTDFIIDPTTMVAVLRAMQEGSDLIAQYHSHTRAWFARLSLDDRRGALHPGTGRPQFPDMLQLVLSIRGDGAWMARAYRWSEAGATYQEAAEWLPVPSSAEKS